ncbi:helicase-exonuclease AddAB subunit AddA [Paenibacillus urinalis]|uniref:ATP-dependent helicase/nuclease subunit A n=1 Tax=Paenibacillus urinalis TaxID=521520 RepID=A0AAX3MYR8_9BACL|nr:helicase-exonuclease AddAB subunit AddA [Paenibacillus urinalis]WDH81585.1 helicase-exonuclease AddAB subunit AddA [Paenibacillus urinalis]WDH97629.1 helicase-exonuclease AddAB subunit AddA [Paenibacillus urinalis]WDI01302.1 helicase-exonuclease AddAB subunit AddA [Paenibacillus urinalis]
MNMIPKPEGSFWSDDQWKAIASSGEDMLVAAAAGSGKTAVLVERIIRKISDPEAGYSVDRLLIATFTKAAASEMRERIREALEAAQEQSPGSEHLARQLTLLGRAPITTLHSFCMEIIRRYYQLIPLDPSFRILNEYEAELMRQELLMELFEEKYGEESEGSDFRRLVDWFSGERSDDAMYGLVQRLYDFARSHSWPEHWLSEMAAAFEVQSLDELSNTEWVASIMRDAELALGGASDQLKQALAIAQEPEGPAAYAETFTEDLEMVERLLNQVRSGSWSELYDVFNSAAFGKLKSVRKGQADPGLQERAKDLRESVKKTVTELKSVMFGRTPEQFLIELSKIAPLMKKLAEIVILFGERFTREKQSKGVVDFSDLEHYALQILRHTDSTPEQSYPSDAAIEYRQQFDEVLLDEYQDTNTVQEDIVSLISREHPGNRFMVGDVKQSIYRFRLAEPGLFLDKYRRYDHDGGGEGLRIDLARNFRSRKEVVDAVNMLFRQIMNAGVAEIEYDDAAALTFGASFPETSESLEEEYTPELVLIDRAGTGSLEEAETIESDTADASSEQVEQLEMETAELEASYIAARIHQMVGNTGEAAQIYDKHTKLMRPAKYGDIVILLRSARIWTPLMMEVLKREGIPVTGDQSKGFFEATEVEIMLSLLQIVDNPQQDIPLASVLRSPIVGLDEEELALVRLSGKNISFYDAMMKTIADAGNSGVAQANDNTITEIRENSERQTAQLEMEFALREAGAATEAIDISVDRKEDRADGFIEEPSTERFVNEQAAALLDTTKAGEEAEDSPPLHERTPAAGVALVDKLREFSESLEQWRNDARNGSLSELIWRIYQDTGYLDWVVGLPGGMQRSRNLQALYDRAKQYESSTSNRGLFRFLTFVARLKDHGGDLGTVSGSGDTEQAVRIMTIHRSKGLEFPIVFVAGMSKMFNQQDLNSPFMMHKELGFGPRFIDEDNRVGYPTLANLAIRRRAHAELLAEEMRVLYVALTRPKEKMILIGTVKDAAARALAWSQIKDLPTMLLPETLLASGRSYMDWVGPALFRHPDGKPLRDMAGMENMENMPHRIFGEDAAHWIVSIVPSQSVQGLASGVLPDEEGIDEERMLRTAALLERRPVLTKLEEKEDTAQMIDHALSWTYPYMAAARTPASTSVTEMKALLASQDRPSLEWMDELELHGARAESRETLHLRRPKFMSEALLTPTERGTVYHTIMQHMPMISEMNLDLIKETIGRLIEINILLPHQAEAVEPEQIFRFYESEPGQQLTRAAWIRREMPFSYGLPADETDEGLFMPSSHEEASRLQSELGQETVLIRGIVDCLYEVDGKRVLLDYKTDKVLEHKGGVAQLAHGYRFQLDLYARALKDILDYEIDEKWLYFFDADTAVKL